MLSSRAKIAEVLERHMVTPSSPTRFHHVANGTSVTGTFEAAGIPGTWSIWADPLYEGPVPGGLSDTELMDVRRRYLSAPEPVDPVIDIRNWRTAIERHPSYDELILWYEHDLFCQLNLVQLLSWVREHLPSEKPVSLVCIGSFPGHPRFKGLGELPADELGSLLETRKPVSEAQYETAARAWLAFRQPTPEALDALRHTDTSALPYLAAAIGRFLQEYPWTRDGLSRSERRLLELAAAGPIDLIAAFPRMDEGEDAYYVTDGSLEALAEALSHSSPPLLSLAAENGAGGHPLQQSVTLTETGRAVLAGQRDLITTCGIDRWLGGVHVQGNADVWRWDDRRQRMVAP